MQKERVQADAFPAEEALVLRAKSQDSGALSLLISRYLEEGKALARGFRAAGLEHEDLTQEALLGLLKAVRSYDAARGVPFPPYAALCMRRQLLSAVKSAGAGKHKPLSDYIPLDDPDALSLYITAGDRRSESPESIVIMDEEARGQTQQIQSLLSAFEQDALNLYLAGLSHAEMAQRLKATPKSVDNALQRVKRKLRSMKL